MKQLGLNEIREKYLAFFESKGHLRAPSFPLVPQGDKSLLLINSGMAPLKPYFSGEAPPPSVRMTTCQKCVRMLDIENVGKTSRHGSFFEMLGNFSFGDYFKREAIFWAWEFVTQVMEMPPELIHCSVYEEDDEAWDIWTKEVGIDPSHMARLGKADNFWEHGAGPCGPCSELYFDRGPENGCGQPGCKVGCDCDRYVEFWNLVFTQFNNDGQGHYTLLSQKNIDTGMGLERLACVMQGVNNLFEVDTVQRILQHAAEMAGVGYGDSDRDDVSLRVITDHIRSSSMMICDGVLPSNEGRGYVLRRLLRRAARHGRLLGITEPFLHVLSGTVVEESGQAYPELRERAAHIQKVIQREEEAFAKTIGAGLKLLADTIDTLVRKGGRTFLGEEAFRLYDTFGFPVDMTKEMVEEQGLALDMPVFERLMQSQRERARAARAAQGDSAWASEDLKLPKDMTTDFVGYDTLSSQAAVLALFGDGLSDSADEGQFVTLVLDKTPFYAESGGQMADKGDILSDNAVVAVTGVKKTPDGKILHRGEVISGTISVGDAVTANVDEKHRRAVSRAHSATHLLQAALRDVLGDEVHQLGSYVEADRLRFDFPAFHPVTPEQLQQVNRRIHHLVLDSLPVSTAILPLAEAREQGAMALFGEKYDNDVRVVRMGGVSMELCGGTHVQNTSQIGSFMIISESSVAAGVRRVEALTGLALMENLERMGRVLNETAAYFKANPLEVAARVSAVMEELRVLHRELDRQKLQNAKQEAQRLLLSARAIGPVRVIAAQQVGASGDELRAMADFLRDKDASMSAVLASVQEDKVTFCACCGKDAIAAGLKAGALIKEVCRVAGGSGGGKPDIAMGGGKNPALVEAALAAVYDYVSAHVQ